MLSGLHACVVRADARGLRADALGLRADALGLRAGALGLRADALGLRAEALGLQKLVFGVNCRLETAEGPCSDCTAAHWTVWIVVPEQDVRWSRPDVVVKLRGLSGRRNTKTTNNLCYAVYMQSRHDAGLNESHSWAERQERINIRGAA